MRKFMWVSFLLIASSTGFASSVSVISPSAPQQVGDSFIVTVNATGMVDLYSFQFDLSFNPNVLATIGVQQGSLLAGSGNFIPGTIDNIGGTVTWNADFLTGSAAGVTGDGSLASFTFKALASGISPLSLGNTIFLDSTGADIRVTLQNGAVSSVPIPRAVWLFGSALASLMGLISKRRPS